MDHNEATELLGVAAFDNFIRDHNYADFVNHVERCETCAHELARLQAVVALLKRHVH